MVFPRGLKLMGWIKVLLDECEAGRERCIQGYSENDFTHPKLTSFF
jgi:hypothetical protein